MPTSVPTSAEFNEQVERINALEQSITKLDERLNKLVPTVDRFGVKLIYQNKLNGEAWFMDPNNFLSDPKVLETSNITSTNLKFNVDGSFKLTFPTDSSNRFNIVTSGGYDHTKCVLDWNTLATRGYMQNPQDWRNVEMTAYVRINSIHISAASGALVWYCRGGHHSNSYPCEGSSYKGNIMFDGQTRFQKEMGHNSNTASYYPTTKSPTGVTLGKWFGYKFCCFDLPNGDVKLENHLDLNNDNNWVKVKEQTDTGSWGANVNNCGGGTNQKILWGGPQAVFRFDSVKDIDFAKMSIREIG